MNRKLKDFFLLLNDRRCEFVISTKEYFRNNIFSSSNRKGKIERNILLNVHSIEKGTSMRDFIPGRGKQKVLDLCNRVSVYLSKYSTYDDFVLSIAISTIKVYLNVQKEYEVKNLENIEKKYSFLTQKLKDKNISLKEYKFGSYHEDIKSSNDYFSLIHQRHSIRMFEKEKLNDSIFFKIAEYATLAPTACNRQPCKFYYANDDKVEIIDELITGNIGFKGEVPNYIIVTSDRKLFSGEEYMQWYINGGIYLHNIIMACESLKLGACIMQWKAFYKNEKKLKKICNISKSEAIIAVIAVGVPDKDSKVLYSQRREIDNICFKI